MIPGGKIEMTKQKSPRIDVVERIKKFNAGRDPERLALKYRALADNPFSFLRGTCHLFYEDLPAGSFLNKSPAAWICGDLHLENMGSYKGDNRLTYFDLNDFDESILAPAHWELSRFLVSVLVAAKSLKVRPPEAIALCHSFLDAYAANLTAGSARWVERTTSEGMVRDLLRELKTRPRSDLLDSRTDIKSGKRKLRLDGKKALPVDAESRQKVVDFMDTFAKTQPHPEFFKVIDVARRIAGTGSLGIERYVILVRGRGGAEGNFLLDLKYEPSSALTPYVPLAQPKWKTEAERVVSVQRRVQAVPPAFLSAISIGDRSYVLKELLPSQDRVALELWNKKLRRLEGVMKTMGAVVAWAHLRSSGRQGSATADEWIAFGAEAARWRNELLDYAQSYANQVLEDWSHFAAAFSSQGLK
jgi:uncharacterized protein (DUF2252 family)